MLAALEVQDRDNEYDILLPENDAALLSFTEQTFRKTVFPSRLANPVLNILWHNTALCRRSEEEDYDLIHIPTYRRIPVRKKVPVVATVHDLATFTINRKYDPARMFFNRRIVPSMIRNADHVITVSQFTRDDVVRLIGMPEDRITVIYSGIDRTLFHPVPGAEALPRLEEKYGLDAPFLVYVSRVEHPAKNHLNLVRAFEMLKKKGDFPLKLVFAGADWNGAETVKSYVRESPVADDVQFLGFVATEDIPLLYSAAELMVYPSYFEGFGFPVIEALACGCRVCCSNTSSLRELAGDVVPTFAPGSAAEICARIEDELQAEDSEEERRRRINYASGFDWAETARQVLDVYALVAGGPS